MAEIRVGDKAPDFKLPTADRKLFHLAAELEKGPVIVAFFPFAFTSTCTAEFCHLTSDLDRLRSGNVQVVGVSIDSPPTLRAWAEKEGIHVPLAADWERQVTPAYGVLHKDRHGLTCPQRAVFVVGRDGKVVYTWVGEHLGLEPPYEEVEKAAAGG